jgi:hypothetical protein
MARVSHSSQKEARALALQSFFHGSEQVPWLRPCATGPTAAEPGYTPQRDVETRVTGKRGKQPQCEGVGLYRATGDNRPATARETRVRARAGARDGSGDDDHGRPRSLLHEPAGAGPADNYGNAPILQLAGGQPGGPPTGRPTNRATTAARRQPTRATTEAMTRKPGRRPPSPAPRRAAPRSLG